MTTTAEYPNPGSEIPGQPGYVVGVCGHRVAGSEWQAGFRTCERCPARCGDTIKYPSGTYVCVKDRGHVANAETRYGTYHAAPTGVTRWLTWSDGEPRA